MWIARVLSQKKPCSAPAPPRDQPPQHRATDRGEAWQHIVCSHGSQTEQFPLIPHVPSLRFPLCMSAQDSAPRNLLRPLNMTWCPLTCPGRRPISQPVGACTWCLITWSKQVRALTANTVAWRKQHLAALTEVVHDYDMSGSNEQQFSVEHLIVQGTPDCRLLCTMV